MDLINSLKLNIVLFIALIFVLCTSLLKVTSAFFDPQFFLIYVCIISTSAVVILSIGDIIQKKVTVNQLAAIALFATFLHQEWLSATFINLMIVSARLFGIYTESKAKNTIKSLLKLRPESVKIKKDNQFVVVPLNQVKKGDQIVVEAGDRIPVDGIVISGNADIDQSSLTGESLPISVGPNHQVFSSTLNLSGSLLIRADKIGADTTFQKIINLVESAQNNKIKYQTVAEKFAGWYIIITVISSVLILIISRNVNLVISFLLVSCADDIAVAVPLAYWAAIAQAAKNGIIIKGGNYLEVLAKIKTIITDKTGTITKARLKVVKTVSFSASIPESKVMYYAAIAESVSEHPLAKAVMKHFELLRLRYPLPTDFIEQPGGGVKAICHHHVIIAGSPKYIQKNKITITPTQTKILEDWEKQAATAILIAVDKKLLGFIALEDEVKPEVRGTLKQLTALGVNRIVLLTGDNEFAANVIAQKTGITEVHANLKPQDKLAFVEHNLSPNNKIAYIGDGVNDSASLAQADVSFAMGAIGTDSAIEAADIAIMDDNFSRVDAAISLAKTTRNIIIEDFTIWGIVNTLGLYLVFAGYLNPPEAALFNFVTDFFPLINSFRIFGYKINRHVHTR